MEVKHAVRRIGRVANSDVFTAAVSREKAQRRLGDELVDLLGGSSQPIMSHLIDAGKLSESDIKDAEKALQKLARKERRS